MVRLCFEEDELTNMKTTKETKHFEFFDLRIALYFLPCIFADKMTHSAVSSRPDLAVFFFFVSDSRF